MTAPDDKGHGDFAESKIREIVENNSKARQRVMQLRRQLMDLEKMRPEMDRIIPRRASSGPLWTKV